MPSHSKCLESYVRVRSVKAETKSLPSHLDLYLVAVTYSQVAFPGSLAQYIWFHNENPQAQWQ